MGGRRRKHKKGKAGVTGAGSSGGQGGGFMQSMVRGFRGVVGSEAGGHKPKRASLAGNIIWTLLLIAALGLLLYRFAQ